MSEPLWAQPTQCRSCRYPVGQGGETCHNCGTPLVFLSVATFKGFVSTTFRTILYAALITMGLYLCFKVSPLLLLIPILCVFGQSGD